MLYPHGRLGIFLLRYAFDGLVGGLLNARLLTVNRVLFSLLLGRSLICGALALTLAFCGLLASDFLSPRHSLLSLCGNSARRALRPSRNSHVLTWGPIEP